jgi:hypothetical protein
MEAYMTQYRKKFTPINAFCFDENPIPDWFLEIKRKGNVRVYPKYLEIDTLEGTYRVNPGDWILKEEDRLFSLKPEIFEIMYEPI